MTVSKALLLILLVHGVVAEHAHLLSGSRSCATQVRVTATTRSVRVHCPYPTVIQPDSHRRLRITVFVNKESCVYLLTQATRTPSTGATLSTPAAIGIAVGASVGALLLAIMVITLIIKLRPKSNADGTDSRYYKFDYNTESKTSLSSQGGVKAMPTGMESTIALHGGPSEKSVRTSITTAALTSVQHPDRGEKMPPRVLAPQRIARNDSAKSATSAASEDAIAAPELSDTEPYGTGVGFLDERGNPVVRGQPQIVDTSDEEDDL